MNDYIATLITFILLLPITAQFSGPSDRCIGPQDKGLPCADGKKAHLQWYYDNETCVCLAFKYNGCGGNSNRFNDFESCTLTCLPLVDGFCSLHKPPAKNNKGEPLLCSDERKQIQKCPEDYICKPVVFVGACCPKASEELYERSVHPKCAIGSIVKTARSESNLLGKSCVDEFCPANSRCVQEELTAFCCQ
ncbi:Major allergen Ani s 1 [Toxocara canis]|uniref:Major allergen Ani s 1 n=1 Tax=Toxocara canis TaxID=6265 RepID=A0A0B2V480_TOXCA|nr:Major allergen Ani s 1 [Toxocara canis]